MITREQAKKLRAFLEQMSANATDEQALDNILAYPKWVVGKSYVKDERIRYGNVLYKVLQNHTSQSDWTPDVAVSLFVKVSIEEYPQWVQPTGSHDAYQKGDKVTHNEKHWESLIDANIWEPGTTGTESLWKEIE